MKKNRRMCATLVHKSNLCMHKSRPDQRTILCVRVHVCVSENRSRKNVLHSIGSEVICLDGFISIHFIIPFKLNSFSRARFFALYVHIFHIHLSINHFFCAFNSSYVHTLLIGAIFTALSFRFSFHLFW